MSESNHERSTLRQAQGERALFMDNLYKEEILEHYKYPHNHGRLENPNITFEDSNPVCGDVIRIDMKVDNNVVTEIRFDGKGCAISLASASMLTDMVEGKTLEEVKKISKDDILHALGIELGPVRLKCALLCLKVLKAGAYGLKEWPT